MGIGLSDMLQSVAYANHVRKQVDNTQTELDNGHYHGHEEEAREWIARLRFLLKDLDMSNRILVDLGITQEVYDKLIAESDLDE